MSGGTFLGALGCMSNLSLPQVRSLMAFRARLLCVVGVLPVIACGGKVRFSDDDGVGGSDSGGGGAGGSTSSVINGGGGWCGDAGGLDYLCFESDTCPGYTTPQAAANIEAALIDSCESGCGCTARVDFLACGPDPDADLCCYYGVAVVEDDFCEGRPFVVDGVARTADLCPREDWAAPSSIDVAKLTEAERNVLAAQWEASALYEHASVASFSRFLLELLSLGAPAELVREAGTALRDEVRHAELCFGIASALRGAPVGPSALAISTSAAPRASAEEIVFATVREGCVGETLSALVARAALDGVTDPAVRAALEEIVADELRHAELAWKFVAWACSADVPGSALEGARRGAERAFAVSRATAVDAGGEHAGEAALDAATARAFGFLTEAERRAHAERAFEAVVVPARDALLAGRARREGRVGGEREQVGERV